MGLLRCGHVHPRLLPGGDYPERFRALLEPAGLAVQDFDADEGDLPASVDDCAGWLLTPSRSSLTAPEPWMGPLVDFVDELIASQRRVAGVCFGHQLLAAVGGGRVERAAEGWGVGVHDYEVVADPTGSGAPPAVGGIRLVASHEDQVVAPPPGAEVFLRSPHCPIAGFRVGRRVLGVQPHPELSAADAATLIDARADLLGPATVAAARSTLKATPDQAVAGGWLAGFLAGDGG